MWRFLATEVAGVFFSWDWFGLYVFVRVLGKVVLDGNLHSVFVGFKASSNPNRTAVSQLLHQTLQRNKVRYPLPERTLRK